MRSLSLTLALTGESALRGRAFRLKVSGESSALGCLELERWRLTEREFLFSLDEVPLRPRGKFRGELLLLGEDLDGDGLESLSSMTIPWDDGFILLCAALMSSALGLMRESKRVTSASFLAESGGRSLTPCCERMERS